ncbi:hypothetical protein [Pseudomonas fluorescens]|nr:hypothetical protein [Pseudomonas fluorescens]
MDRPYPPLSLLELSGLSSFGIRLTSVPEGAAYMLSLGRGFNAG